MKNEGAKIIILKFFLAPIILFLGIGILFLILDLAAFLLIGGFMIAYFFPPLGKESVIPMGIAAGIHPILISLVVAFLDMINVYDLFYTGTQYFFQIFLSVAFMLGCALPFVLISKKVFKKQKYYLDEENIYY